MKRQKVYKVKLENVKTCNQLKNILETASWQRFEKLVGKIFSFHGYEVEVSKVVTFTRSKRQYDVIAKQNHTIIADCKKWSKKRRIKYGLKNAVEKQIERVKKLNVEGKIYPMVIVSCKTPIEYYRTVPVISVYKLNKFLSNFPSYKDMLLTV